MAAKHLCQRRAFSPQFRVVRISRLIGNFDTTVWHSGLQVARVEPRYKRNSLVGGSTKNAQTHKTPLSIGVAFCVPALVTGLPANYGQWLYPLRLSQAVSAGLPIVWAASLADALAERLLFLRAGRNFPSSRYITGTMYIAIPVPFLLAFRIRDLSRCFLLRSLQSRNPAGVTLQKTVDCRTTADTLRSNACCVQPPRFAGLGCCNCDTARRCAGKRNV
jgi:hypothetical protein